MLFVNIEKGDDLAISTGCNHNKNSYTKFGQIY